MALQLTGGQIAFPVNAFPKMDASEVPSFSSGLLMDAVGEKVAFIGEVYFAAGPGTSKLFSNAGGAVQFRAGAVTWAGTTTIRIGLQDVSTTVGPPAVPVEDWTTGAPPYKDWVRGVDALLSNTWTTIPIAVGSRTIAHGDLIAVVFDMTVVSGTDSVIVSALGGLTAQHRPLTILKSGAGPAWATSNTIPNVVLTCDDGTLASLKLSLPIETITGRTFSSATAVADEYGNIVITTGAVGVDGMWGGVDPDSDFSLVLYSDALNATAPTQEQITAFDLNQGATATNRVVTVSCGQEDLPGNSKLAVTVRPGAATVIMQEIGVNAAGHLAFWPGGTNCYKCTRLNATGVLTTNTAARMIAGVLINKWDDGVSVGGANLKTHPGMGGGMRG